MPGLPFRHAAGFGKRIEFFIIAKMLKEGLDLYVPLVDDMGVDAVIRRQNGSFIEVQIKARSQDAKAGTEALFTVQKHELRENFWFVFYSERLDKTWIMSSSEFVENATIQLTGKYKGLRYLSFKNKKRRKALEQFEATDFSRLTASNG